MTRIAIVTATVALAIVALGSSAADAQTPLSRAAPTQALGRVSATNRGLFDVPPKWTIKASDTWVRSGGFRPHRHWSWLFPNASTVSPLTDPLGVRHGWSDPLLRRHWWR